MLSWLWSCLVVPTAVVAKTYWIECKFVAKALNLSMRLLRKDALSMKLLRKPELSINICRESLYVINVAFGYKKIIRPEGPAKKIILLRFCPKKISRPGQKFQAPPWISNGPCLRKWSQIKNRHGATLFIRLFRETAPFSRLLRHAGDTEDTFST